MIITFLGAAHEVTGSCTLLEVGDKKGLVDYGMEQGKDLFENEPLPLSPSQLDFVLLTHAHIDHAGLLPLLYKQGFRGAVYATEATVSLSSVVCTNAVFAVRTFRSPRRSGRAARPCAAAARSLSRCTISTTWRGS